MAENFIRFQAFMSKKNYSYMYCRDQSTHIVPNIESSENSEMLIVSHLLEYYKLFKYL